MSINQSQIETEMLSMLQIQGMGSIVIPAILSLI